MTAEAPGANRPWDGRRLLRFLTSLAMLALAVTLRLSGPVTAEPVQPVAAVVQAADSTPIQAQQPAESRPAPLAVQPAAPVTAFPAPVLRAGAVPATGDSRAPPTR
ncbi:hypothetical protein [Actinoplanes sp. NPDC020271]|uniref:hypothetical protein n=1 Tax=Actinoplanes sp. NPDC020271 TaxID=3363896 RepID=UPI00379F6140